jgi:hypothetical protein
MFDPVKVAIAGALVFALGGLFLIGQPLAQQRLAQPGAEAALQPGAAADVPVGPDMTYFTGTEVCTGEPAGSDVVDGIVQIYRHNSCDFVSSDPRFTGTMDGDVIVYGSGDTGPWTGASVLTNENGAWRGTSEGVWDATSASPLGTPGLTFHYGVVTWVGEGAYEGSTVHLYMAGTDAMTSHTGWISAGE